MTERGKNWMTLDKRQATEEVLDLREYIELKEAERAGAESQGEGGETKAEDLREDE